MYSRIPIFSWTITYYRIQTQYLDQPGHVAVLLTKEANRRKVNNNAHVNFART